VLSVRDECFEVMEGERSSLVKENYINILKEVSEIGLKPVEESTGGGLIETGCHGADGWKQMDVSKTARSDGGNDVMYKGCGFRSWFLVFDYSVSKRCPTVAVTRVAREEKGNVAGKLQTRACRWAEGRFVVLYAVKTQRGSGGVSVTSVLGAGELSASRPDALHRRRTAGG
jgi:hypothetical protein